MIVFDFTDYREFLKDYIKSQPKQGWGSMSKIAEAVDMTQAHISQIMAGAKDFSIEQALRLTKNFFSMSELETEYFVLLVQLERAGTVDLKNFFKKKLDSTKLEALKLKNHFTQDPLTEIELLRFYSNWKYSAIRMYCSLDSGKTFAEILEHFKFSPKELTTTLEFLVHRDLLVRENIKYKLGAQRTFAPKGSMAYLAHTKNWRLQGLARCEKMDHEDVFITSTMSLSKADYEKFRHQVLESFKALSKQIETSPAEEMVCLTLDLFKI